MDKKAIVLNGPSGCGKDTLANFLSDEFGASHIKFAAKLKVMTNRLYGIADPKDIYKFEDCKDIPNPAFYGLTPRQAYIEVAERYIKPVHGMSFFGDRLLETIEELPNKVFVASDGGLIEELIPVVEGLGAENVFVLRILRSGFDFDGDSRSYYPASVLRELGVKYEGLPNDWSLQEFLGNGSLLVQSWLDGEE